MRQNKKQENINYITDLNELSKKELNSKKRIIGLFADDGIERGKGSPTQSSMTNIAIEHLKERTANCSGFFLMSEGSQIDWAGHDNDAKKMIEEFRDFDLTIKEAIKLNAIKSNNSYLGIVGSLYLVGEVLNLN